MPPRKLVPWSTLTPHRDGQQLATKALRGHLWWWRRGEPAPDLEVPDVAGPEAVDWSGFPAEAPGGYETKPGKRRVGKGSVVTNRNRERLALTLSPRGKAALERVAKARGLSLSECVERLALEADEKK